MVPARRLDLHRLHVRRGARPRVRHGCAGLLPARVHGDPLPRAVRAAAPAVDRGAAHRRGDGGRLGPRAVRLAGADARGRAHRGARDHALHRLAAPRRARRPRRRWALPAGPGRGPGPDRRVRGPRRRDVPQRSASARGDLDRQGGARVRGRVRGGGRGARPSRRVPGRVRRGRARAGHGRWPAARPGAASGVRHVGAGIRAGPADVPARAHRRFRRRRAGHAAPQRRRHARLDVRARPVRAARDRGAGRGRRRTAGQRRGRRAAADPGAAAGAGQRRGVRGPRGGRPGAGRGDVGRGRRAVHPQRLRRVLPPGRHPEARGAGGALGVAAGEGRRPRVRLRAARAGRDQPAAAGRNLDPADLPRGRARALLRLVAPLRVARRLGGRHGHRHRPRGGGRVHLRRRGGAGTALRRRRRARREPGGGHGAHARVRPRGRVEGGGDGVKDTGTAVHAAVDLRGLDRERAVAVLFEAHHLSLVRLAVLLGADDAEDVVAEAFYQLYRRWRRLRSPEAAATYLRSVVVNLTRMRIRHLQVVRKHAARTDEVPPHVASGEDRAVLRDDQKALVDAVRALPARQREALVLRFWLDLRESEIADAMGISAGSVKVHVSRGMAALSRTLEERR
ncbi:hypothetical protein CFP66_20630 [Pseudonocardia sp. MH-G8]|nr:hypothetical protein CFP66_20630 [Pseudonocardia sp. MH-G8]